MTTTAKAQPPDPLCLSVTAARRELGDISRSTLYELLARQEIASVRVGSRRLVLTSSPREFVARQMAREQS